MTRRRSGAGPAAASRRRRRCSSTARPGGGRPGPAGPRSRPAACGRPRSRRTARAPSNRASTRPARPARPQLRADRRDQRLELGGEQRAVASRQVEQRLDAKRVAGQEQLAGRGVGQREREHAAEALERLRAPQAPGLDHDLGVGVRPEADAAAGQLFLELPVVVQLAVVDHDQVVLDHRLVGGGGQVDDRQPPVAEVDGDPVVLVGPDAAGVRAAVGDPVGHDLGEPVTVRLLVAARDPAHGSGARDFLFVRLS
jgi:hypothetical protein